MFRSLFRQRVTAAGLEAYGLRGTGSYSTLVRRPVIRGHLELTFCQWRYWRQLICTGNGFVQFKSHPRSKGVANSYSSECPQSVTDVFKQYHALLDENSFDPECVIHFTTALRSAVYCDLRWLPWLHYDNHVIAFMQILMNGKTEELLRKPLYNQEHFDSISHHLEQLTDHLPSLDCPSVLLSLLYSGVEKTKPMVQKLLARCHDSALVSDIHHLRDLSHILQTLGGRDFLLAERILSRLDDLISRDIELSEFEVQHLCVTSPILAVFMSQDLLDKTSSVMLAKLKQQSPHLDMATIGSCLRFIHKMKFRVSSDNLTEIKALVRTSLHSLKDCSHLQSYHIAEVCHNAKRMGCYFGDVMVKIQARSLQLLRENEKDLHVRDVTNLLFAFSKTDDPSLKQEANQLLMDHLDDADVLTLSNIADNILDLGLDDHDLISTFQFKVMQNIDNISQYITRLVKILRLLRERHNYDVNFSHQLCSILLKILQCHQGYDPTLVVVVAQYILPNVRTIIPAVLMESLLYAIPRCNLSLMLMVLSSLDKIGSPRSRSLHNQMLELRSCMQQNIGRQIHSAQHAGQLANLVKGLHIKSRTKDLALLDHIMDHYPSLTASMTQLDYLKTLHVFRRLPNPYYHPEVFEDLIAFTKDNYCQLDFSSVLDLVTILTNAGYRPENFEDFSAFVIQVLEEMMETEDCLSQITLAHHLSLLGIFPDRALGQIFTFDYLEKVDSTIEEEKKGKDLVRNLMMQLNRSVILECPHLDVPWFHQQYCQDLLQSSTPKGFQKRVMEEEVEMALQEVMTGQECFASHVCSPYFHPIDFEVVLDSSGQPVSTAAVKLLQPEELGYQRVALMFLGSQRLCINGMRRRGQYLRDRRQLEILGYRVEEISRQDWHSMALREWGAKLDFVRNKLFPHHDCSSKQTVGAASTTTSPLS